jgi:Raf kinase inhibitor-like YbhB/YbcL family protein
MAAPRQPFTVMSPAFEDGGELTRRNAGDAQGCGGGNVSPPLAWSHAPPGTMSHAVIVYDPDGGKGLGSVHWVAYGLAPSVTALPEGAGTASPAAFVGGINNRGTLFYNGPCPPVGDRPHHYVFSVYALDLPPDALKGGLTRDEFLAAIRGHSLAAASIVARYAR